MTTITSSSFNPAATGKNPAPPAAADVFKALDSAGKGYLTVDDLKSAKPPPAPVATDHATISAAGAQRAERAQRPDAAAAFAEMDGDQDGKLTSSEFESAVAKHGPPPTQAGAASGAAAAPAGHSAPAGGAAAPAGGGNAASSASSTTYEAADHNQDGKVTQQEQISYDAAHAKQQAAVKAYEEVAANGQASGQ